MMTEKDPISIANAMTVDVEEHFQVTAFAKTIDRRAWNDLPSRVVDNTIRLLDLFDEVGVKATFFMLGWVAQRHPELMRRIAENGHELASHGHSHKLIYEQSPQEFREELKISKALIEDACGIEVQGYRAASFSIRATNLWALDAIAECGFSYDSSVFPVMHDLYGMPGAPRGVYRVELANGLSLVEVPPTTLAFGRSILPVAGGGYLRIFPRWFTNWAIARLNRQEQRSAIIYVHPWEVDPEQPRVKGAPWRSKARHYTNLRTTLPKLRFLLQTYDFGTMRDLIEQSGELESISLEKK
jgi:polysaccharide deacetylase family protein (PEP-CTERM system associated)